MPTRYLLPYLSLTSALLLLSSLAHAGGFSVLEQSGRGLGTAFAGATTGFGDGSSAYYNPAALTALEGDAFHLGNNLIIPNSDFDGGSTLSPALGGGAVEGNRGGNGGELGYVPNIFLVKGIQEDSIKLGMSVTSPFGLLSNYSTDWVGRYHGVKTELLTINLNPSIAFKINEHFSIGAGVSAMYADAELTNAIDFGTIGLSTLGPETGTSLGFVPQGLDGFGTVTGDDWATGYNVGAYFSHGDTSVGLHFRSRMLIRLEGDAEFNVPGAAQLLTATDSFVNTGASAKADLPETLSFDLSHELNDRVTLVAGAIWTHWTRFDELRVKYDSAQADTVTEHQWENTWRFAVGSTYRSSDRLSFRTGFSLEKTPIPSAALLTPRIPDSDRLWLAAGVTYHVAEDVELDFSFSHIFLDEADSENVSSTGNVLSGDYDLSVDIAALSITWRG